MLGGGADPQGARGKKVMSPPRVGRRTHRPRRRARMEHGGRRIRGCSGRMDEAFTNAARMVHPRASALVGFPWKAGTADVAPGLSGDCDTSSPSTEALDAQRGLAAGGWSGTEAMDGAPLCPEADRGPRGDGGHEAPWAPSGGGSKQRSGSGIGEWDGGGDDVAGCGPPNQPNLAPA